MVDFLTHVATEQVISMSELLQILGTVQLLGMDIPTTVLVVLAGMAAISTAYAGKAFLGWVQGVVVWVAVRHTAFFLISSAGIGVGTLLELTQEAGVVGFLRDVTAGIPLLGDLVQGLLPATVQLLIIL